MQRLVDIMQCCPTATACVWDVGQMRSFLLVPCVPLTGSGCLSHHYLASLVQWEGEMGRVKLLECNPRSHAIE
jgi:hypothetical protein